MRADSGPYPAAMILQACNGTLVQGDPEVRFSGISTDSREIKENDLFVPLKGPNFDGHQFLIPALEAGARGSLLNRDADREIPQDLSKIVLIQVKDTLQSLSDLASACRSSYPIPLIAVTGSSGKTTVKEMIAAVLRRSHRPLVSVGNLNNLIGLPMTVLNLGPQHTAAVVEAGINRYGEMDDLARAAMPDVAVITSIGPVHLEGLGAIENVASEKFKLVRALSSQGTAVVPAESPLLEPFLSECPGTVVRFGIERGDCRAVSITMEEPITFRIVANWGEQEITLPMAGRHNIANCLAAAAAVQPLGVCLEDVAAAMERFSAPAWRNETVRLPAGRTLIRDCYNANPESVTAALRVLAETGRGPRLALLADMRELGQCTERLHADVGREAARLRIDRLVFVGSFGESFAEGFRSAGGDLAALTLASDKETAWQSIGPEVRGFRTILVKGSRAMLMEELAQRVMEAG